MKRYRHPSLRTVTFETAMQALSDPGRVAIVRDLLKAQGQEFACNEFPGTLSKATRSHHFQILREAGFIRTRVEGTKCMTSLRLEEVEKRFPGLLQLVHKL